MTLAESHLDSELLSAYLDEEVESKERPEIEDHLQSCLDCRRHLEGLRRVTDSLHRLERASPPPILDAAIQRHIVLERRSGLSGLWQANDRLRGALSSHVATMFALVFALAVILYLFSSAVERRSQQEPILVPVLETAPAPVGATDLSKESPAGEALSDTVSVGSRTFDRRANGWWQRGLSHSVGDGSDPRTIAGDSAEARALFADEPRLERLLADGGALVLELEGAVVEIVRR